MTIPVDLQAAFEQAREDSQNLTQRPDHATLLQPSPRPGFSDMVARAKWDAWNGLKGTAREDAMRQYIELIGSLE